MKSKEKDVSENTLYHDTWTLLRKYRDVVWSLELSVQKVRRQFQIEYGSSIEDFLESIYIAGVELDGTDIAEQAKSIERSNKMLKLVDHSVNLLREKHKNGEEYYWILFYSFLSPQQYRSVDDIIEQMRAHVDGFAYRSYYRKRKEAIDALSSVLWGYTSRDSMEILEHFFPKE